MTPTPPSTSSSNHNSPDGHYRIIRKRNRIPLSCAPCRQRKLKCNRSHPCDNCIKRGEVSMCTYASPAARKKSTTGSPGEHSPDEMQNRIDRLENLVLSLMTNGSSTSGPAAAAEAIAQATTGSSLTPGQSSSIGEGSQIGSHRLSTDDTILEDVETGDEEDDNNDPEVANVAKSIGVMKVDSNKTMYISEAHWFSLLAELSDFKTYFMENKKSMEERVKAFAATREANQSNTSMFLFNYPPATKAEVLRSFPPKVTTDVLVSRFFDVYNVDAMFRILHGPTYQKQYNQHWSSPLDTDVAWLGLSYAMMMIALVSFKRLRDEPPEYRGRTDQMYKDYRRLASQCLALTDPQHPSNYTIEILILYLLAEVANNRDVESGLLMGVTMTIRQAMKMGYHRDSKYFPDVTPFSGEMRRRVWAILQSSDLKISAQFGLPPIIRTDVCNTELPRNLYDDELDENMPVLTPSRPITESTPMAYIIYKSELIQVCYSIVEEVQRLKGTSYETVMALDAQLREVHEKIPPHLRLRSLESSMQTEQSSVILKRYMLEIQYLKYLCLVHRKYAGMPRAEYSTRTCISSAMDILTYQVILFDGLKPGGPLSDSKIFVTSLATHDFLLAAMIVSTHLYRSIEADRLNGIGRPDEQERERRGKMRYAVEQSLRIWDAAKEDSLEAFKATGALAAMLKMLTDQDAKVRATFGGAGSGAGSTNGVYAGNVNLSGNNASLSPDNGLVDVKLEPEHHAAMTLGMLSTGGVTNNNTNQGVGSGFFSNTSSTPFSGITPTSQTSNIGGQFSSASATSEAATDAPSPFSVLFNTAGFSRLPNYSSGSSGSNSISGGSTGSGGWDLPNGVDWDAFDSYVNAGGTMDSASMVPMWPVNFDPAMDPSSAVTGVGSPGEQPQQGQTKGQQTGQSSNNLGGYGNIFMGMS